MSKEIIFAVAAYKEKTEEPSELKLVGLFNSFMAAERFTDMQRKKLAVEFITLPVHNLDKISITEFDMMNGSVGVSCERIVESHQNAIVDASARSIAGHIRNGDMA